MKKKLVSFAVGALIGLSIALYGASTHPEETIPIATPASYDSASVEITEYSEPEPEEEILYFDIPLSHELQDFIFAECDKHGIAPAVVIAIIQKESNFDDSNVSDGGDSIGLMQIQEKWHGERMERLGCTDLYNPFENVKVGIDYLAELFEKDSELYFVLMAYNGGQSYAKRHIANWNISDYAIEVSEQAAALERSIEF